MSYKLDKDTFLARAGRLYDAWDTNPVASAVNSISLAFNPDSRNEGANSPYTRSKCLQRWLFGYELPDLVVVLTKKRVVFLGSEKKNAFVSPVVSSSAQGSVPPVTFLVRNKADNDKENVQKLVDAIKDFDEPTVGDVGKEKEEDSKFIGTYKTALKDADITPTDISPFISVLLAVKDAKEQETIKQACEATVSVWGKKARRRIVDIIDREAKVRHGKFAEEIENAFTDKKFLPASVDPNMLESCYSPIVQSAGNYNLKFSAQSDNNHMRYAAVCVSFGTKYKDYCCNLSRTMMLEPSDSVEQTYELLLSAQQAVIDALRPGKPICDAFNAGVNVVKEKDAALLDKMPKSFGFATGLAFRDANLLIGPKTTEKVKAGMVFCVHIGFNGIANPGSKEPEDSKIALVVSDTVLVNQESTDSLTDAAKKKPKSVSIRYKPEEEDDDKTGDNKENIVEDLDTGRGKRSVLLTDQTRKKATNEEKRRENQKRLSISLNERAKERLAEASETKDTVKVKKSTAAYKSQNSLPDEDEIRKAQVFVDRRHEAVILPIFGIPVPFHISMIKNVSTSVEGDFTYLRINLTHPGAALGSKDSQNYADPLATFLKELTYRSTNLKEPGELSAPSSNLNTAFRMIKELQKRFRTREAEEREKEGTVKQDKLVLIQNKSGPRLKDLYVRPNIISKRINGTLEAHINGFRYTSLRGDRIDLLFNNIRHSFFQPCDGEMLILLHFHLKQPVLFGKKKYSDIQFYTEVGETHTDLGKYHHMQDRDDMYQEQAERELRHKLNTTFKQFCEKVERLTNQKVEFDTPFRDLAFTGVPFRSAVKLMPTSSCLVSLSEWPPFVITVDDLELVHFERVHFSLKNFDMVFVFKDYTRKVEMIQLIPMDQLDSIKDWVNECDLPYSEGVQNLNWAKILKTINDDPEDFIEMGGWTFLGGESDDPRAEGGAEEESDTDDDEFKVEGDSDESGSAFGSSEEDEESGEETESESEGSLESDESSGKDWSDLEEDAKRADRERYEDEEVDRRKGGGGGSSSSKPSHSRDKSSHGRDKSSHSRDKSSHSRDKSSHSRDKSSSHGHKRKPSSPAKNPSAKRRR